MAPPQEHPRSSHALLLGGAVPLGMCLFDLLLFAGTERPADVAPLLSTMGIAILAGALLGALLSYLPRLTPVAVLVAAVLSFAPGLSGAATAAERAFFPALLTALLLWWAGGRVARGIGAGRALALGVGSGLLGGSIYFLVEGAGVPWFALVPSAALLALACPKTGRIAAAAAAFVLLASLTARAQRVFAAPTVVEAREAPVDPADPKHPNCILIVLDTVRADRMGMYGYERDTTPELDAFAEEHLTRHASAHSTSSWTLPSHASLFTGLAPAEHGVTHPRAKDPNASRSTWARPSPLPTDLPTLAGTLRGAGWRTCAIVANHMLGRWSGLDSGFERYDDRPEAHIGKHQAFFQRSGRGALAGHKPYRDAATITDLGLDWIDDHARERPFFLFLNYMDAHTPYVPPAPFDAAFGDERPKDDLRPREVELLPLLYDRELAYLDHEVTRFLRGIEDRGLLEGTLVIITSDHGEAFGEHEFWSHDWALYEEMIHVPLLVQLPGGRRSAVSDVPLDGIEVHDLVLETLGVTSVEEASDGPRRPNAEWFHTDGLGREKGVPGPPLETLARDLAVWFEGSRKWIVSSRGEVALYDLSSDPGETTPLELTDAERTAALERARAWWDAHPPAARTGEALDAQTLDRLHDLGYAGDEGEQ